MPTPVLTAVINQVGMIVAQREAHCPDDDKELEDVPVSPITKKYLKNLLSSLKH